MRFRVSLNKHLGVYCGVFSFLIIVLLCFGSTVQKPCKFLSENYIIELISRWIETRLLSKLYGLLHVTWTVVIPHRSSDTVGPTVMHRRQMLKNLHNNSKTFYNQFTCRKNQTRCKKIKNIKSFISRLSYKIRNLHTQIYIFCGSKTT